MKTILKLNNHDMDEEKATAERLGLNLVGIPFEASTIGSAATCKDVARALAVLDDQSNWPVYVHCSRGRDRTGYMVGLFRELAQHWSWEQIDRELASYGHTEGLRRAYPQISRELKAGTPTCGVEVRGATGIAAAP